MRASRACALGLLACVASLVGCDHATKVAAGSNLRDHAAVQIVPGVLDLTYSENRDVAFDAFSRLSLHPLPWVLVALGVAALGATLLLWARRRGAAWPAHLGFACVVAGAIGNLGDRAAHGHVVDFIRVGSWPVFNVADVLVVIGGFLLVLAPWGALEGEEGEPG